MNLSSPQENKEETNETLLLPHLEESPLKKKAKKDDDMEREGKKSRMEPHEEIRDEKQKYQVDCITYFEDAINTDGSYKFFRDEIKQGLLRLILSLPDVKTLLEGTVNSFYDEARNKWSQNDDELMCFFIRNIMGCDRYAVLEDYKEWKTIFGYDTPSDIISNLPRLVEADFKIQDTKLSHKYDLKSFFKSYS